MISLWNSFSYRSNHHLSSDSFVPRRDNTLQDLLQLLANSHLDDVSTHEVLYVGPGQYLGRGATFSVVQKEAKGKKLVALKHLIRDDNDDSQSSNEQYSTATNYRLRDLLLETLVLLHSPVMHHRNVVDLMAYGWDRGGIPYLVIDYADLGSLDQFIRDTSVSPDQKTQIAVDIASALECLHACDIVHGDLKLENVLVFSDDNNNNNNNNFIVKLSDFGFCCSYELGNLKYRGTSILNAPEIRRGTMFESLSQEDYFLCDVYAYGILVWEVFSSGARFYSTASINIATTHTDEAEAFLSQLDQQNMDLIPYACDFIDAARPTLANATALKNVFEMTLARDPALRQEIREVRLQLDPSNCFEPEVAIPVRPPVYSISDIAVSPLPWNVKKALVNHFLTGASVESNIYRGADAFGAAICYAIGVGVNQDMEQSFQYLAMSAQKNYGPARVIQEAFIRHELVPRVQENGPEDYLERVLRDAFSKVDVPKKRSNIFNRILREYYSSRNRHMASCPLTFTHSSLSINQPNDLEVLIQSQDISELENCILTVHVGSDTIEYDLIEYLVASHPSLAEALIRAGWKFEEGTDVEPSILAVSCSCGATNVVRCLIELYPWMARLVTPDGVTPLHWLFMFPDHEIDGVAKLLTQSGCPPRGAGIQFVADFQMVFSGPALHWAIMACSITACRALLELGAELNTLPPIPPSAFAHPTDVLPLALAVSFFLPEVVKLLLDYGAVTYWKDTGLTALHVIGDAHDRYRLLLYHGKNIKDAIHETINLLLEHMDDKGSLDTDNSPLEWIVLCCGSFHEVLEVFLQHPISSNADFELLEKAAMALQHDEANTTKMRLLLDYLRPILDDDQYVEACTNALTRCVIDGTLETARVLLQRLIPNTAAIINEKELLHIAAQENHVVMIELLLEYGADINHDIEGTAAATAASHGKVDALSKLINWESSILSQPTSISGKTILHEIAGHNCSPYECETAMAMVCNKYSHLFLPVVDNYDNHGLTALHQSVVWGNLKVAALLVQTLHATAIPVYGTSISPTTLGRFSLDHLPWIVSQQSRSEVELHRQRVLAVVAYLVETCKMEPPEDDVSDQSILRHLSEPTSDSWKDDDQISEWYRKPKIF